MTFRKYANVTKSQKSFLSSIIMNVSREDGGMEKII